VVRGAKANRLFDVLARLGAAGAWLSAVLPGEGRAWPFAPVRVDKFLQGALAGGTTNPMVGPVTSSLVVRQVFPNAKEYRDVLEEALSGSLPTDEGGSRRAAQELLKNAEHGGVTVDLLFGAFLDNRLVGAALGMETPGRAALVLTPSRLTSAGLDGTAAALRALTIAAWRKGLVFLESLTDPSALCLGDALRLSGFRNITQLLYLRRRLANGIEMPAGPHDLGWVSHEEAGDELFARALEQTYVGSLDCPEVMGVRQTADVLASHRAVGIFDPRRWWVALCGGEPVGVLLLSRFREEKVSEVVYMGVAQPSRGTGVGNALLAKASASANADGVTSLALAVDRRNAPARRLYERWRFRLLAAREVWIATPT